MPFITVRYSCNKCGIKDVTCKVPARESSDDISEWMSLVTERVGANHFIRSPFCEMESISDLKIPIDRGEDSWIGKYVSTVPSEGDAHKEG